MLIENIETTNHYIIAYLLKATSCYSKQYIVREVLMSVSRKRTLLRNVIGEVSCVVIGEVSS